MADKIRIGLSLSLTGAYAMMGRQADAALQLFALITNSSGGIRVRGAPREIELLCLDDASNAERCADIYRSLCGDNRVDLLLGPYSSELVRVAAPIAEEAEMLLVNHGGADDDIYSHRNRLLVGVLSPAGDYFNGFVHLIAGLKLWRKRIAIVHSPSGFGTAIAGGIERESNERYARRKGVRVRVKYAGRFDPESTPAKLFPALRRNRVNALVSAGSYEHDVAAMRAIVQSSLNIPVLGCVAAGVQKFRTDLGDDAEGLVGPSQWEEQVQFRPELGPSPREFIRAMRAHAPNVTCDYPAAQAFAAALLTKAAIENAQTLDPMKIREAFSDIRTSTFFGDFAIDRVTGRQIGHRVLLVQWHGGQKVVIDPEAHVETGTLEFPTGWQLILSSFQKLKLTRRRDDDDGEPPEDDLDK
ncbi:MAG TPA: amino acid ABC transporter substrate-binding protein [Candidatus Binataceae bacterium]|nr:amino acid ABC transporter substrate-binding protein [Candidatus Binataceae bacterium]